MLAPTARQARATRATCRAFRFLWTQGESDSRLRNANAA